MADFCPSCGRVNICGNQCIENHIWVWENEWNCIPVAVDYAVYKGFDEFEEKIAEFSSFDWGHRNASYMAYALKEMLEER